MSVTGRYFIIRSRLNDFVMTLDEGGIRVVMRPQIKTWPANQLWFEDHMTGTIRSKASHYCLDVSGRLLQVCPYKCGVLEQNLLILGETIALRHDPQRVLDIVKENKEKNAEICVYDNNGQSNQHWTFEYGPAQYVTISSMSTSERLATTGTTPGADVIVRPAKSRTDDAEVWYEDRFGVLHSKLNAFALDSSKGNICLKPYEPSSRYQQFIINDNTLLNKHDHQALIRLRANPTGGTTVESGEARNRGDERWLIRPTS